MLRVVEIVDELLLHSLHPSRAGGLRIAPGRAAHQIRGGCAGRCPQVSAEKPRSRRLKAPPPLSDRNGVSRTRGQSRLQVLLEAMSRRFVWEFNRDNHAPRPMLQGVPARAGVVPFEALIQVCCTTDVMSRRIGFAAENVDESGPNPAHENARSHASGQRENPSVPSRIPNSDAGVLSFFRRRVRFDWQEMKSDYARCASFVETDFA